jgi:hypothetical protein
MGGFVRTLALTFMIYQVAPMMGMGNMDIAGKLDQMFGGWTVGMVVYFRERTGVGYGPVARPAACSHAHDGRRRF